jgi:hypothetical protein
MFSIAFIKIECNSSFCFKIILLFIFGFHESIFNTTVMAKLRFLCFIKHFFKRNISTVFNISKLKNIKKAGFRWMETDISCTQATILASCRCQRVSCVYDQVSKLFRRNKKQLPALISIFELFSITTLYYICIFSPVLNVFMIFHRIFTAEHCKCLFLKFFVRIKRRLIPNEWYKFTKFVCNSKLVYRSLDLIPESNRAYNFSPKKVKMSNLKKNRYVQLTRWTRYAIRGPLSRFINFSLLS